MRIRDYASKAHYNLIGSLQYSISPFAYHTIPIVNLVSGIRIISTSFPIINWIDKMDGFRLYCFALQSRSFPVLTTISILVHLFMVASLVVA